MLAPNTDVQAVLKAAEGHPRLAFLRARWFWAAIAVAVVALVVVWWTTGTSTTLGMGYNQ